MLADALVLRRRSARCSSQTSVRSGSGRRTGDRLILQRWTSPPRSPLKLTLVWDDPPAFPPAGQLVATTHLVVTGRTERCTRETSGPRTTSTSRRQGVGPNPADATPVTTRGRLESHHAPDREYGSRSRERTVPGTRALHAGFALGGHGRVTGGSAFPQEPRIEFGHPQLRSEQQPDADHHHRGSILSGRHQVTGHGDRAAEVYPRSAVNISARSNCKRPCRST